MRNKDKNNPNHSGCDPHTKLSLKIKKNIDFVGFFKFVAKTHFEGTQIKFPMLCSSNH